jgi:hypothetical protein
MSPLSARNYTEVLCQLRRALEDREFAPKQAERSLSEIYLGLGSSTRGCNKRVCSQSVRNLVSGLTQTTLKRWLKAPNSTARPDFRLLATPQCITELVK